MIAKLFYDIYYFIGGKEGVIENRSNVIRSPLNRRLLYPPYPKDRGMLWFYVEAARRPPPAARHPPPAMVLTR